MADIQIYAEWTKEWMSDKKNAKGEAEPIAEVKE